jgi:hypothetical protein
MKRIVLLCVVLAAALATAASAGRNVNGVYETKLSGLSPSLLNADWLLSIAQGRAFAIARNGKVVVGGKVKIKGSRLTFHDVVGPIACKGAQATGVYSFSLSGKTLRLKRVRDTCQGRILVLTSRPFTKVR